MVGGRGTRYTSLDHFVLQSIGMFRDVSGAICVNIVGNCRVLAIALICCVCSSDPINGL